MSPDRPTDRASDRPSGRSTDRPRLVVLSAADTDAERIAGLGDLYTVVVVEGLDAAIEAIRADPSARLWLEPGGAVLAPLPADGRSPALRIDPATLLERLAEGIAVVDEAEGLQWRDERLAAFGDDVVETVVQQCRNGLDRLNRPEIRTVPPLARPRITAGFSMEQRHFEVLISPLTIRRTEPSAVTRVVAIVWESTEHRAHQRRIDDIEAAGLELTQIDARAIKDLTLAERLQILERRIKAGVLHLLNFDNFEVRLIDRESRRLDLVISEGLTPLKIGEVIHALPEGNGISGLVASTGTAYLCADTRADPLYREGLDNAMSALTVPLRLNERIVGVFNIESNTPNAFTQTDLELAELFGRYIATAMNILDIMVVERSTTNAQVSANVLAELQPAITTIAEQCAVLARDVPEDDERRPVLDRIIAAARSLGERITACTAGPRTILETEQELRREDRDPVLEGKRILVADDEAAIRDGLHRVLTERGAQVDVCPDGAECIRLLEAAIARSEPYDAVLSDIRMPDRNGYEVFRAAKAGHPATHVILMTGFGYDPHHSIVRSSQEGLHAFLFKPFKASQMIDQLTRCFVETHEDAE